MTHINFPVRSVDYLHDNNRRIKQHSIQSNGNEYWVSTIRLKDKCYKGMIETMGFKENKKTGDIESFTGDLKTYSVAEALYNHYKGLLKALQLTAIEKIKSLVDR